MRKSPSWLLSLCAVVCVSVIGYLAHSIYMHIAQDSVYIEPSCSAVRVTDEITWLPPDFHDTYSLPYQSDGYTRERVFLMMKDGIKIAANFYLPTRALREGHRIPTIVHGTRYYRTFHVRFPFSLFLGDEYTPRLQQLIEPFVYRGYAYVFFDVRGTGLSQGSRVHDFAPEEVDDFVQLMEHIVAQPWSNGKLGSLGFSYEGMVSEMLAALDKRGIVKAVVPMFTPLDTFRSISHPGGIFPLEFFNHYTDFVRRLEHNDFQTVDSASLRLHSFGLNYVMNGPGHVDQMEEADREKAFSDHLKNWVVSDTIKHFQFADTMIPLLKNKTLEHLDQSRIRALMRKESLGVFTISSWYDSSFVGSAIVRFKSLRSKFKKLILGPWNHAAQHNSSPFSETRQVCFHFYMELMRFFDFHLRPEFAEREYYRQEPAVRYFMLGEEAWYSAQNWPPEQSITMPLYLNPSNLTISTSPPTTPNDSSVSYSVNFTVGPGVYGRWNVLKHLSTQSLRYNIPYNHMLTFTMEPASQNLLIAGDPKLTISIQVNKPDALLFAYLLDFDPTTGSTTYVTEGHLRLIHRKVHNESVDEDVLLFRTFRQADAAPMPTDSWEKVVLFLHPIAYRLQKGHSLMLSLSGWDKDNFDNEEVLPMVADRFQVQQQGSLLELPVLKQTDTSRKA